MSRNNTIKPPRSIADDLLTQVDGGIWKKFLESLDERYLNERRRRRRTAASTSAAAAAAARAKGNDNYAEDYDDDDDDDDDDGDTDDPVIVVVSSESDVESDSFMNTSSKAKGFDRLWEKARYIIFHRYLRWPKASPVRIEEDDRKFPYEMLEELGNDLRRYLNDNELTLVELHFVWESVLQWLSAMKEIIILEPGINYDEKLFFCMIEFMVQYINYNTTYYHTLDDDEMSEQVSRIMQSLSMIFNGDNAHIVMTLLRIDLKLEYRLMLHPMFEAYLTNRHLCESSRDFVVYIRLVLCFKRWKMITPSKAEREKINEIAAGKPLRVLQAEGLLELDENDLNSITILPRSVPKYTPQNQSFGAVSDLIGYAADKKAAGTRLMLVFTKLDLDTCITKYFHLFERHMNNIVQTREEERAANECQIVLELPPPPTDATAPEEVTLTQSANNESPLLQQRRRRTRSLRSNTVRNPAHMHRQKVAVQARRQRLRLLEDGPSTSAANAHLPTTGLDFVHNPARLSIRSKFMSRKRNSQRDINIGDITDSNRQQESFCIIELDTTDDENSDADVENYANNESEIDLSLPNNNTHTSQSTPTFESELQNLNNQTKQLSLDKRKISGSQQQRLAAVRRNEIDKHIVSGVITLSSSSDDDDLPHAYETYLSNRLRCVKLAKPIEITRESPVRTRIIYSPITIDDIDLEEPEEMPTFGYCIEANEMPTTSAERHETRLMVKHFGQEASTIVEVVDDVNESENLTTIPTISEMRKVPEIMMNKDVNVQTIDEVILSDDDSLIEDGSTVDPNELVVEEVPIYETEEVATIASSIAENASAMDPSAIIAVVLVAETSLNVEKMPIDVEKESVIEAIQINESEAIVEEVLTTAESSFHQEVSAVVDHTVIAATSIFDQTHMNEDAPIMEESPIAKNVPWVELESINDENLSCVDASIDELSPITDNIPNIKASIICEQEPIVEKVPITVQAAIHEESPIIQEVTITSSPTAAEVPMAELEPMIDGSPQNEETPLIEDASLIYVSPIEEDPSVVEEAQVNEASAIIEVGPVIKASAIIEEVQVIEASVPAEEVPTVEEDLIVEEEPMIVRSPQTEETSIIEDASLIYASPIKEDPSVVEEAQVNEASAIIEVGPVTNVSSIIEEESLIEASAIIEVESVTKASANIKEVLVIGESVPAEEVPTVEEDSFVEEEPMIDGSPQAEETSIIEDASLIFASPIDEDQLVVEEEQVNEASAIIEVEPVTKASAIIEEVQVIKASVPAEEVPTVEEDSFVEEEPMVERSPQTDETPIIENASLIYASPIEENPSVVEEAQVNEASAIIEVGPVSKASAIIEEVQVIEASVPAEEKVPTVEEDSFVEEEPMIDGSPQAEETPIIEDASLIYASSIEEDPSVVEEARANESSAIIEVESVTKASANIEEVQVIEALVPAEEVPMVEEYSIVEEEPMIDRSPQTEETPIIADAPLIYASPIEDDPPIVEEAQVNKALAISEVEPVTKASAIIKEVQAIQALVPAEEVPTVEDDSFDEEEPMIDELPQTEETSIIEDASLIYVSPIEEDPSVVEEAKINEASAIIEEVQVIEASVPAEEVPTVEEDSFVGEEPIIDEPPQIVETSIIEDASLIYTSPIEEAPSVVEEAQVNEASAISEVEPVTKTSAIIEEVQVIEASVPAEEVQTVEEDSFVEEGPMIERSPQTDETPIIENASLIYASPIEENPSVVEEAQVNEALAIIEVEPVTKASVIIEEGQVIEASVPAEEVPTVEEDSIVEEEPMIDRSPQTDETSIIEDASLIYTLSIEEDPLVVEEAQVNEASVIIEVESVTKVSAIIDEVQVIEASLPAEEVSMVEEDSFVGEEPMIDESPQTEETSIIEDASLIYASPIEEYPSVVEEAQINEASAIIEVEPVTKASAIIEEMQVIEASVPADEVPTVEEDSFVEEEPMIERSPQTDETPIIENASLIYASPIEEDPSVVEEAQVNEALAIIEVEPVTKASAIIEEGQVIEASVPAEEVPTVEEDSIVEEEPMIDRSPQTDETSIIEDALIIYASPIEEDPSVVEEAQVNEASAIIEVESVIKSPANIEEVQVIKASVTVEELPMVKEEFFVEKEPMIDESPKNEEAPNIEDPPLIYASPISDDSSALDEVQVNEASTTIEEASVTKESAIFDEMPVTEALAIIEDVPMAEENDIGQESTIIVEGPLNEESSIIKETPILEAMTDEGPAVKEDLLSPVIKTSLINAGSSCIDESLIVEEALTNHESTIIKKVLIIEASAIIEGVPTVEDDPIIVKTSMNLESPINESISVTKKAPSAKQITMFEDKSIAEVTPFVVKEPFIKEAPVIKSSKEVLMIEEVPIVQGTPTILETKINDLSPIGEEVPTIEATSTSGKDFMIEVDSIVQETPAFVNAQINDISPTVKEVPIIQISSIPEIEPMAEEEFVVGEAPLNKSSPLTEETLLVAKNLWNEVTSIIDERPIAAPSQILEEISNIEDELIIVDHPHAFAAKATPTDEETTVMGASPIVENTLKVEAPLISKPPPTTEKAMMTETSPMVQKIVMIKKDPVVEETATVEELSVGQETPIMEASSNLEKPSNGAMLAIVESSSIAQVEPIIKEESIAVQTLTVEETSTMDVSLNIEEAPIIATTLIVDEVPIVKKEDRIVEETSPNETSSINEEIPIDKKTSILVEEESIVQERPLIEKPQNIEATAIVEKLLTIEVPPIIELSPIIEEVIILEKEPIVKGEEPTIEASMVNEEALTNKGTQIIENVTMVEKESIVEEDVKNVDETTKPDTLSINEETQIYQETPIIEALLVVEDVPMAVEEGPIKDDTIVMMIESASMVEEVPSNEAFEKQLALKASPVSEAAPIIEAAVGVRLGDTDAEAEHMLSYKSTEKDKEASNNVEEPSVTEQGQGNHDAEQQENSSGNIPTENDNLKTSQNKDEKYCISGEVSSTTSPHNNIVHMEATKEDPPMNVALVPVSSPNPTPVEQEVLSVNNAVLQPELKAVEAVQVVKQQPESPVVVSGSYKPGSLLFGIDYSDVSSDNDNYLSFDSDSSNSSIASSSSTESQNQWQIIGKTNSSTCDIFDRKQCAEGGTVAEAPNTVASHSKLVVLDDEMPTCSKYVNQKPLPSDFEISKNPIPPVVGPEIKLPSAVDAIKTDVNPVNDEAVVIHKLFSDIDENLERSLKVKTQIPIPVEEEEKELHDEKNADRHQIQKENTKEEVGKERKGEKEKEDNVVPDNGRINMDEEACEVMNEIKDKTHKSNDALDVSLPKCQIETTSQNQQLKFNHDFIPLLLQSFKNNANFHEQAETTAPIGVNIVQSNFEFNPILNDEYSNISDDELFADSNGNNKRDSQTTESTTTVPTHSIEGIFVCKENSDLIAKKPANDDIVVTPIMEKSLPEFLDHKNKAMSDIDDNAVIIVQDIKEVIVSASLTQAEAKVDLDSEKLRGIDLPEEKSPVDDLSLQSGKQQAKIDENAHNHESAIGKLFGVENTDIITAVDDLNSPSFIDDDLHNSNALVIDNEDSRQDLCSDATEQIGFNNNEKSPQNIEILENHLSIQFSILHLNTQIDDDITKNWCFDKEEVINISKSTNVSHTKSLVKDLPKEETDITRKVDGGFEKLELAEKKSTHSDVIESQTVADDSFILQNVQDVQPMIESNHKQLYTNHVTVDLEQSEKQNQSMCDELGADTQEQNNIEGDLNQLTTVNHMEEPENVQPASLAVIENEPLKALVAIEAVINQLSTLEIEQPKIFQNKATNNIEQRDGKQSELIPEYTDCIDELSSDSGIPLSAEAQPPLDNEEPTTYDTHTDTDTESNDFEVVGNKAEDTLLKKQLPTKDVTQGTNEENTISDSQCYQPTFVKETDNIDNDQLEPGFNGIIVGQNIDASENISMLTENLSSSDYFEPKENAVCNVILDTAELQYSTKGGERKNDKIIESTNLEVAEIMSTIIDAAHSAQHKETKIAELTKIKNEKGFMSELPKTDALAETSEAIATIDIDKEPAVDAMALKESSEKMTVSTFDNSHDDKSAVCDTRPNANELTLPIAIDTMESESTVPLILHSILPGPRILKSALKKEKSQVKKVVSYDEEALRKEEKQKPRSDTSTKRKRCRKQIQFEGKTRLEIGLLTGTTTAVDSLTPSANASINSHEEPQDSSPIQIQAADRVENTYNKRRSSRLSKCSNIDKKESEENIPLSKLLNSTAPVYPIRLTSRRAEGVASNNNIESEKMVTIKVKEPKAETIIVPDVVVSSQSESSPIKGNVCSSYAPTVAPLPVKCEASVTSVDLQGDRNSEVRADLIKAMQTRKPIVKLKRLNSVYLNENIRPLVTQADVSREPKGHEINTATSEVQQIGSNDFLGQRCDNYYKPRHSRQKNQTLKPCLFLLTEEILHKKAREIQQEESANNLLKSSDLAKQRLDCENSEKIDAKIHKKIKLSTIAETQTQLKSYVQPEKVKKIKIEKAVALLPPTPAFISTANNTNFKSQPLEMHQAPKEPTHLDPDEEQVRHFHDMLQLQCNAELHRKKVQEPLKNSTTISSENQLKSLAEYQNHNLDNGPITDILEDTDAAKMEISSTNVEKSPTASSTVNTTAEIENKEFNDIELVVKEDITTVEASDNKNNYDATTTIPNETVQFIENFDIVLTEKGNNNIVESVGREVTPKEKSEELIIPSAEPPAPLDLEGNNEVAWRIETETVPIVEESIQMSTTEGKVKSSDPVEFVVGNIELNESTDKLITSPFEASERFGIEKINEVTPSIATETVPFDENLTDMSVTEQENSKSDETMELVFTMDKSDEICGELIIAADNAAEQRTSPAEESDLFDIEEINKVTTSDTAPFDENLTEISVTEQENSKTDKTIELVYTMDRSDGICCELIILAPKTAELLHINNTKDTTATIATEEEPLAVLQREISLTGNETNKSNNSAQEITWNESCAEMIISSADEVPECNNKAPVIDIETVTFDDMTSEISFAKESNNESTGAVEVIIQEDNANKSCEDVLTPPAEAPLKHNVHKREEKGRIPGIESDEFGEILTEMYMTEIANTKSNNNMVSGSATNSNKTVNTEKCSETTYLTKQNEMSDAVQSQKSEEVIMEGLEAFTTLRVEKSNVEAQTGLCAQQESNPPQNNNNMENFFKNVKLQEPLFFDAADMDIDSFFCGANRRSDEAQAFDSVDDAEQYLSKTIPMDSDDLTTSITDGVLAQLKLLSPGSMIAESGKSENEPKAGTTGTSNDFLNKFSRSVSSDYDCDQQRINDEEKTALLLDKSIESVLGCVMFQKNLNMTEPEPKPEPNAGLQPEPVPVPEANNVMELASIVDDNINLIVEENQNSSEPLGLIDNITTDIINTSIERILGDKPTEDRNSVMDEAAITPMPLPNFSHDCLAPESSLSKNPFNAISANVPENLFADDESDNINDDQLAPREPFGPFLSIEDLCNIYKNGSSMEEVGCGQSVVPNACSSVSQTYEWDQPFITEFARRVQEDLLTKKDDGAADSLDDLPLFLNKSIPMDSDDSTTSITEGVIAELNMIVESAESENEPKAGTGGTSNDFLNKFSPSVSNEYDCEQRRINNEENSAELRDVSIEIVTDKRQCLATTSTVDNVNNQMLSPNHVDQEVFSLSAMNDIFDLDGMVIDVNETSDCMVSKNYVQKWHQDHLVSSNVLAQNSCTDPVAASTVLELCPSNNTNLDITQNSFLDAIIPLVDEEVPTNMGIDLYHNEAVDDLLRTDGDDLFPFPELDKSQSRSNSFSNDSASFNQSANEDVNIFDANIMQHTNSVACDHSYNKDFKEVENPDINKIIGTTLSLPELLPHSDSPHHKDSVNETMPKPCSKLRTYPPPKKVQTHDEIEHESSSSENESKSFERIETKEIADDHEVPIIAFETVPYIENSTTVSSTTGDLKIKSNSSIELIVDEVNSNESFEEMIIPAAAAPSWKRSKHVLPHTSTPKRSMQMFEDLFAIEPPEPAVTLELAETALAEIIIPSKAIPKIAVQSNNDNIVTDVHRIPASQQQIPELRAQLQQLPDLQPQSHQLPELQPQLQQLPELQPRPQQLLGSTIPQQQSQQPIIRISQRNRLERVYPVANQSKESVFVALPTRESTPTLDERSKDDEFTVAKEAWVYESKPKKRIARKRPATTATTTSSTNKASSSSTTITSVDRHEATPSKKSVYHTSQSVGKPMTTNDIFDMLKREETLGKDAYMSEKCPKQVEVPQNRHNKETVSKASTKRHDEHRKSFAMGTSESADVLIGTTSGASHHKSGHCVPVPAIHHQQTAPSIIIHFEKSPVSEERAGATAVHRSKEKKLSSPVSKHSSEQSHKISHSSSHNTGLISSHISRDSKNHASRDSKSHSSRDNHRDGKSHTSRDNKSQSRSHSKNRCGNHSSSHSTSSNSSTSDISPQKINTVCLLSPPEQHSSNIGQRSVSPRQKSSSSSSSSNASHQKTSTISDASAYSIKNSSNLKISAGHSSSHKNTLNSHVPYSVTELKKPSSVKENTIGSHSVESHKAVHHTSRSQVRSAAAEKSHHHHPLVQQQQQQHAKTAATSSSKHNFPRSVSKDCVKHERDRKIVKEQSEKETREKDLREFREKELRETELRKKEIREKEIKEKEIRDKELKEKKTREKEQREKELREQEMREKEMREKELREKEIREKELREKEIREKEIREKEIREREIREKEIREKEIREKEIRERELREKETREKALKDKAHREKEIREKEIRERETREKELKDKEIKDKEIREKYGRSRKTNRTPEISPIATTSPINTRSHSSKASTSKERDSKLASVAAAHANAAQRQRYHPYQKHGAVNSGGNGNRTSSSSIASATTSNNYNSHNNSSNNNNNNHSNSYNSHNSSYNSGYNSSCNNYKNNNHNNNNNYNNKNKYDNSKQSSGQFAHNRYNEANSNVGHNKKSRTFGKQQPSAANAAQAPDAEIDISELTPEEKILVESYNVAMRATTTFPEFRRLKREMHNELRVMRQTSSEEPRPRPKRKPSGSAELYDVGQQQPPHKKYAHVPPSSSALVSSSASMSGNGGGSGHQQQMQQAKHNHRRHPEHYAQHQQNSQQHHQFLQKSQQQHYQQQSQHRQQPAQQGHQKYSQQPQHHPQHPHHQQQLQQPHKYHHHVYVNKIETQLIRKAMESTAAMPSNEPNGTFIEEDRTDRSPLMTQTPWVPQDLSFKDILEQLTKKKT